MSLDLELESWRQEWKVDTEALPALARRVRHQNRRLIAGAAAVAVCIAIATALALRHPASPGWTGFAMGIWLATLVGMGYAVWVRRGTWESAARTTEAYADLLHRRAVATLRKTVFLRRCLLVTMVAYAGFVAWDRRHLTTRAVLLVAAFVMEIVWMRALERRRRRAVEEAARLVDLVSNASETETQERMDGR